MASVFDPLRWGAVAMVSKAELMARFDDWVTDPRLKLAQLHAFTADSRCIGEAYLGKYLIWQSSGTSHQPGWFVQAIPRGPSGKVQRIVALPAT